PVKSTKIFIQAGAYSKFDNANRVRAKLLPLGNVRLTSVLINGKDIYRVRLGPIPSVKHADKLLASVIKAGYNDSRIIVD
ncbi:MAG: SPOR domain-containing protein, partial [Rhodospirillales bacterium]|nr:SPOR domain-containing protein [Rhodospirillales bacterium]